MSYFSQAAFGVRLEWGAAAVERLGRDAQCLVIIDVISFSTCVSVAAQRGALLHPYFQHEGAADYAAARGAEVVSRQRAADRYSLSPVSLSAVPAGLALVLPSPNGGAVSHAARSLDAAVFCGALRNLRATAAACRQFASVLLVPCGERWSDGGLRPCVEDYVVAGGIAAALGREDLSPEARAAALAFSGLAEGRHGALSACSSARELIERGFAADVAMCLDAEVDEAACRLQGGCFRALRC